MNTDVTNLMIYNYKHTIEIINFYCSHSERITFLLDLQTKFQSHREIPRKKLDITEC